MQPVPSVLNLRSDDWFWLWFWFAKIIAFFMICFERIMAGFLKRHKHNLFFIRNKLTLMPRQFLLRTKWEKWVCCNCFTHPTKNRSKVLFPLLNASPTSWKKVNNTQDYSFCFLGFILHYLVWRMLYLLRYQKSVDQHEWKKRNSPWPWEKNSLELLACRYSLFIYSRWFRYSHYLSTQECTDVVRRN